MSQHGRIREQMISKHKTIYGLSPSFNEHEDFANLESLSIFKITIESSPISNNKVYK